MKDHVKKYLVWYIVGAIVLILLIVLTIYLLKKKPASNTNSNNPNPNPNQPAPPWWTTLIPTLTNEISNLFGGGSGGTTSNSGYSTVGNCVNGCDDGNPGHDCDGFLSTQCGG